MKQTLENVAVTRIQLAIIALRSLISALEDLRTNEALEHCEELDGAVAMMEQWALALKRQHRAKQAPGDGE